MRIIFTANSLRRMIGAAILVGLASPAWSLNILVANDDSCNAEGINTLMDALEAAGHTVTMFAPAGEQSGKSSSRSTNAFASYGVSNIGFSGPTGADNRFCVRIPVDSPEEGSGEEFLVSATPRDSVLVGLAIMQDNLPDLVIGGINDGANIGSSAITSGTVGGPVAAMLEGIPAIAISRARFAGAEAMTYAQGADFIVKVVAQLEANRIDGQPLLPALTGLNINTPVSTARGVAHTTLGTATDLRLGPSYDGGEVTLAFGGFVTLAELLGDADAAEALKNNPDATVQDFADAGLDTNDETSMYTAGFVTITTLDGDLTATLRKRELLQVKLRDLSLGE